MGKPKAPKSPKPPAEPSEPEEAPDDEASPTQLGAENVAFLGRVYTFLFNITKYLDRAKRHGYTQKEHDLGWELWTVASGKNRPFEHWLVEHDQRDQLADLSTERMRTLQEIDTFENLWFPRMRMLIPRVIPKDNAARFAAAFFKDLTQKPLGPEVVDSVKTFLNRVEELKSSAEPGARELYKTLGERGITPKKVEAMRGLIAAAEEHKAAGGAPHASLTEIAKAKEAQLAAVESLKLWYNDWSTTFRGVFGVRTQIALGLTTLKRRKQPNEAEEPDETDELDEAEEPDEEDDGDAAGG
jgi:hypothetical protein